MKTWPWAGSLLAAVLAAGEAAAQFAPYPQAVVVFGSGVDFRYRGKRLSIDAYLGHPRIGYLNPLGPVLPPIYPYNPVVPYSPYPPGAIDGRVVVEIVTPPAYAPAPTFPGSRPSRSFEEETAGVDLDLIPAKKRKDGPLPGVDVGVERKVVRTGDAPKKPAPEGPKPKDGPKPEPEPVDEITRLLNLGVKAFANQEYGLAALRFRQATEVDADQARGHFLLAQAHFATGRYSEAVKAIEQGMRRLAIWPVTPFRPRLELYKGIEAEFDDHVKRLQVVQEAQPENPTYLFLHGYMLWFDGRQADAVPLFQRARAKAADPTFIDAFLKAAAPGAVVAR
jgi:hypothetical protein